MVSAERLLASYPECKTAVAYVELMLCSPPDGEDQSSWDIMMSAPTPMTPIEVIDMIRSALDGETEAKAEEALEQTYHPSFLTYIGAKMGMV